MNEPEMNPNRPVPMTEDKEVPSNEGVSSLDNAPFHTEETSEEILPLLANSTELEMNSIQENQNTLFYQELPRQEATSLMEESGQEEQNIQGIPSTGFVSMGSPLQKKKNPYIRISIILSIGILLGLLGYFIVYPYVARTYFSNPKKVFKTTIQGISKEIISNLPETHDKGIYDLSLTLDSTILEFQKYGGYTYTTRLGFDSENLEMGYSVKNEKKEDIQNFYLKDKNYYAKFSTNPNTLLALGDKAPLDSTTSSVFSFLTYLRELKKEDLTYVVQFFSTELIQSIDEDKLSREEARLTIKEDTLKVTKNLYTMDYQTKVNTVHSICDHMLADEKLLAILSSISAEEESVIKEKIINLKEKVTESDKEDTILFSIFTYGNKSEIIGYEIMHGENQMHYYGRKGNFDGYLRLTKWIEGEKKVTKINLSGEKKTNSTEVSARVNDQDFLHISVQEFTKEKIAFAYTLHSDAFASLEQDINGTLLYTNEKGIDSQLQTLVLSVDIENEELKATLALDSNFTNEASNINVSAATFKEEAEYNLLKQQFLNQILANTPLSYFFSTLSGTYDQDIYDYYDKIKQEEKEKVSIDMNN